jgi:hypothetical protein
MGKVANPPRVKRPTEAHLHVFITPRLTIFRDDVRTLELKYATDCRWGEIQRRA